MGYSLQSIIDRAVQMAEEIGGDFHLDEAAAELLLPHVLQNVLVYSGKEPQKLNSLRRTHAIDFTSGVGALPAAVMPEYLSSAEILLDDADEVLENSYIPYYDYSRPVYDKLGYFTFKDGNVLYKNPDPMTGTRSLVAVTVPAIPSTPSGVIDLIENITEDVIIELVRALRGEEPYINLGNEESQ